MNWNHIRDRTRRFCSRGCRQRLKQAQTQITKDCAWCKKPFTFRGSGEKNNAKRILCSNRCAAKYRHALPGMKERFEEWIAPHRGTGNIGKPNPAASHRMRTQNPCWNPVHLAKMKAALKGHRPPVQGGNGRPLPEPQRILAETLQMPTEYVIRTKRVKHLFDKVPNCYKADIADPASLTAIEVDGVSHNNTVVRARDLKKMLVLQALGWSVLRFQNAEIMADPEYVASWVKLSIALKSKTTTISLPLAS